MPGRKKQSPSVVGKLTDKKDVDGKEREEGETFTYVKKRERDERRRESVCGYKS